VHTSPNIGCILLTMAASALLTVEPLLAQGTGGGLFGATRSESGDRLDFTVALAEAFDSRVRPEFFVQLPRDTPQSGGFSTMVVGAAQYAHSQRRTRIAGTAQTSFRYDNNLERTDAVGHSAGVGANIQLSRAATLQLDQSAAYSPSYLYELFPSTSLPALGDSIPAAPDYRIGQEKSYQYRSGVTVAVGSRRGARVSVSGGYDRSRFLGERVARPNLAVYTGSTTFSHGVRRNLGLSVDYHYSSGDFGTGASTEHRLGVGAEYSRPMSRGRRANIRFNMGRSILEIPDSSSDGLTAGSLSRTSGDATVEYRFRRTWRASASVRRSVEFLAILGEPVLSDASSLSLSGLLTRRLDLSATAGYGTGASAQNQVERLDTYNASLALRFALKRSIALYSEYFYFYYDTRGGEHLGLGLPSMFDQHGVRVGITLWAPAF
jgi:hypothetical protein